MTLYELLIVTLVDKTFKIWTKAQIHCINFVSSCGNNTWSNDFAPRGGGALPYWRWRGRAAGQGMILRSWQYWHRVSCGPLAVINIGTGYLNRSNWQLAGYSVYHRVASQGFPSHNVYDRPAIWAPATVQYCDRVYAYEQFLVRYIVTGCIFCAPSGFATGSGFRPPAAPPPPSTWKSSAPPPPGDLHTQISSLKQRCGAWVAISSKCKKKLDWNWPTLANKRPINRSKLLKFSEISKLLRPSAAQHYHTEIVESRRKKCDFATH